MSTGLRERKKAATRQALHDAAVRLALEHGVENVTVEAIADAAFVSRRTFSNYFASKEQALLHRDWAYVSPLVGLVRARPENEPPLTALMRATEQLSAARADGTGSPGSPGSHMHHDAVDEEQYRTLRQDPALLSELVAVYTAIERDLASTIEQRLPAGPDAPLHARVLAAAFLAMFRVAGHATLEHPDRDFLDLLHQAATLTSRGFD